MHTIQHIQFTTHYFEIESKNCTGNGASQTTQQRWTENMLKIKAKNKRKAT